MIGLKGARRAACWDVYLPAHNQRFAIAPASPADAHRPLRGFRQNFDKILSVRTERELANDFTLRFQNRFVQVLPHKPLRVRPANKILFEFRLDGSTHIRFKDTYLPFKSIAKPPAKLRIASPLKAAPKTPQIPYRSPRTHPLRNAPYAALYEASSRA